MGRTCSMNSEMRSIQNFDRKTSKKTPSLRRRIDERIILK